MNNPTSLKKKKNRKDISGNKISIMKLLLQIFI